MDEFQYDFQGVHITNQHVVWYHPRWCVSVADAEFRDCRIDVQMSARGLILVRTRFIDCTIHFKRPLTNFPFDGAYFEGCRIKGRLRGCDFGRRIDDDLKLQLYYTEAGIVDTDLSAARLDACRFMNCDLSTLRLPLWPCFTVPNHEAVREQALRLPWPGRTYIMPDCWEQEPPGTVAITYDAQGVCKRYGVTEAELRAVVEQIPGVIM